MMVGEKEISLLCIKCLVVVCVLVTYCCSVSSVMGRESLNVILSGDDGLEHYHHHHRVYIKGYDMALNHENIYSRTIMHNETLLYCIELNCSTTSYKFSIDVLLDSPGFSLYIDVNNEKVSSTRGNYKYSIIEKKDSAIRVTTPLASSSSHELSKIYLLAIPHSNSTQSETLETNEFKLSLTLLISEYSISGGAISFLVLLSLVVVSIILLLVIAGLCSFIKPEQPIEKKFELQDQENPNEKETCHYTNASHLEGVKSYVL